MVEVKISGRIKRSVEINLPVQTYAQYAERLTDWLYDQYGIENRWPTVMRNTRTSYHRGGRQGTPHQIVYGWASLREWAEVGYHEMKSIRWVWSHGRVKGLEAVHRIVLHEFAHVLQVEQDGREYGSCHNDCFVKCLRELQVMVPFGEFGLNFLGGNV